MTPVFLDTVGLVAVWTTSDQWHPAADAAFNKIVAAGRPYVTTTFVLLECANAASRRPYRQDAVNLHRVLVKHNSLIVPTDQDGADAWSAYESGRPGDPGIVDCVSIVVMRRLSLTDVFSNDQHFTAAGFKTLF